MYKFILSLFSISILTGCVATIIPNTLYRVSVLQSLEFQDLQHTKTTNDVSYKVQSYKNTGDSESIKSIVEGVITGLKKEGKF